MFFVLAKSAAFPLSRSLSLSLAQRVFVYVPVFVCVRLAQNSCWCNNNNDSRKTTFISSVEQTEISYSKQQQQQQ